MLGLAQIRRPDVLVRDGPFGSGLIVRRADWGVGAASAVTGGGKHFLPGWIGKN